MAEFYNHELPYVVEDEMTDFDNDYPFEGTNSPRGGVDESLDSDFEDDFELSNSKTDTSASEARNGKDMQGIPWERFDFTRDHYRETRCQRYKNYESLPRSEDMVVKDCKLVEKGHSFYNFQFNTRILKPTVVHFQLRNLLWATSKHDVYLMQNYSVMHWSSLLRRSKEVLNVAKPIVSSVKYPGSCAQTLPRVQISSMAVKDNLLVAGGFQGELVCKYLNQPGVAFSTRITDDENSITNAVDICKSPSGSMRIMTANNDAHVRVFDAVNFSCLSCFSFPWSVNNTSVSPDGKLLAVLGDGAEILLADAQSGKVIANLEGHLDYSFSSAWHPNGLILATGNQDTTCRLWDIRYISESVSVLKGKIGAIRAVKFTSDGQFLAMAEPADFVHIFDTKCNYEKAQEIDIFGEIAGISFSPDTEALFVGVADRTYGSLLEFNRGRCSYYLDSIL